MKWYSVDDEFMDYLRSHESRIPRIDYGNNKFKPFFGQLFSIGDLIYVTPVSSPKTRHHGIKETLDFIKLYDGKRLIAVVNLRFMFPAYESDLTLVEYKTIDNFRSFDNEIQKNAYIALMKKEMKEIQKKAVDKQARRLYKLKYDYPHNEVSLRCFDFKDLEQKCVDYVKQKSPS